jgi:hypothetical protein
MRPPKSLKESRPSTLNQHKQSKHQKNEVVLLFRTGLRLS